jgi:superfamily II DNA or RNA helicase
MDIEVKPINWILPNRVGYNKNIYDMFNPSKYKPTAAKTAKTAKTAKEQSCSCSKESCELDIKTISLFPQQRIIKDYMQFDSPYRGILLYHELGSGKSAASIAAAEGYINRTKVVIMTPASLSQNYENELMKISTIGLNLKKSWTQVKVNKKNAAVMKELAKYAITGSIIKKDGLVWIPLYQNDMDGMDGVEIIKEKTLYSKLDAKYKELVNETIVHIIRNRYKFINYNGLTAKAIKELGSNPFDNTFVIIDEIHNFISRIVNGSRLARSIYNSMLTAKNIKMVLLSGTPIINQPYEIATLINLIRGPMDVYELTLLTGSDNPDKKDITTTLIKSNLYKYIDEIYYDKTAIYIILLPKDFMRKDEETSAIEKRLWDKNDKQIMDDIIKTLNRTKLKLSIKPKIVTNYALPNNKDDFDKLFINSDDPENIIVKNIDLFKRRVLGTLSYYKTTGSEFFPSMLPTTFRYLYMTNHQLNKYVEVRRVEMDMDDRKKRFGNGNGGQESSVYRAFSRMVCNFVFPDDIKRVFPKDIRIIMKKELAKNDTDGSSGSSGSKGSKGRKDDKIAIDKAVASAYEKGLEDAMDKLADSDALDKENLRSHYSPKFAQMLQDMNESPGSVLVYSQFRMVEGLGIFKEVLNRDGYVEINIVKNEEFGYIIEDVDVFDKIYDNKRYVVFNADRTKTNILMNIFNGDFLLLPDNIRAQLPDDLEQKYGKLVKTMMITQSGAEGISLKNVRRVLITEYFWNSVRIDQVIGRAVRTCSHMTLPKEDQNVGVYKYIMRLTKEQLENNPTLRKKDNELTTDEHIYNLATKKENLTKVFLDMLKSSSIDCVIHADKNKPLSNGYKCYNWPININENKLSYTQNIIDDNKIQQHRKMQKMRKNLGTVVSRDGVKYVLLNNKLYDYFSYVNSGLLYRANI